jgi:hypothetical protein
VGLLFFRIDVSLVSFNLMEKDVHPITKLHMLVRKSPEDDRCFFRSWLMLIGRWITRD